MSLHWGILAVTLAVAVVLVLRLRRRFRAPDLLLAIAAIAAFGLEGVVTVRELRFGADWRRLAETELTARARGVVEFLQDQGARSLESARAVGRDPDTRVLLSAENQLARTARRPVFLDLMDRLPGTATAGLTVYDLRGAPRAWSGWSPTATLALAREPSRTKESLTIRPGNIYTVLEAVHPVRDDAGDALGFVVYQEPLRVQYPLQNRFLQVDDVLSRLEGSGGVRADVALELSLDGDDDPRALRPGALKLSVTETEASATAAILATGDVPVGRVSLSGLSRPRLLGERLQRVATVRAWALAILAALVWLRLWSRSGDLPSLIGLPVRLALLVGARWVLLANPPRGGLDPLGVFDPSWFASIRFAGLLRSPGDLLLTAIAALLAAREARRLLLQARPALVRLATRRVWLTVLPGLVLAILVGSLVGFHWTRVFDIARNANVPLFGGFDPFTSTPVAALEVSLLFLGAGLLISADALVSTALALLARLPAVVRGLLVAALAAFGSAVKVPSGGAWSDFLWPLPALLALATFHALARRWPRPGGTAILVVAVLGSLANFAPLSRGIDARRRELVELFALEHTESPSNSRHFLLATTLDQIQSSSELAEALGESPSPEHANLAFVLWAQSPLPNVQGGCYLRLLDANGRAFSTFSLGFPPELRVVEGPDQTSPHFRREEIGPDRVDVYSDTIGIGRGERVLGRVELSMAYFDDFSRPRGAASSTPALFTNLAAPDEFLRFRREVPDRVDRYRGDLLVSSTDPEGGLGRVVPSIIVQALAGPSVGGRWVERRIGGHLYDVYCVRERDGELTVGYLTFGIERTGWLDAASLLARAGLVTLVLASGMVAFLMAFAWVVPASSSERLSLPALGFRERVIGGFLIVSLLPTVLLGFAGRRLFVDEKRREFQSALEEDLRVAVGLLGRRLSDAARNVASSAEVAGVVADPGGYQVLSSPASVDGVVLLAANGQILASSRSANLDVAIAGAGGALPSGATEFFRRRGAEIYACATVPVTKAETETGRGRGATVLTFQRIDGLLATELERRTGSAVSFFAAGVLAATSKPELYQAEILSDLLEPLAYLKVELEGARRTLLESRVGATSFLSSYAPLPGADGEVVATLATLAPFQGGGLDLEASLILSRIYFLCLAVFTAAIAAAIVLASRLTHPISALTAGAESLRAGALGHQIRTRASGEIARLVRSFNSMSTRLAESEARDRERREYIEAIIRHVGSGVVSFDAEGRVATVNDAAGRILGVDPARLIGHREADTEVGPAFRTLLAAVEPVRRGEREEVVHEVEVAPVAGETSGESTGEEGELRMLRLVATRLVDSEGNAQGAVAVFEDLTDLIRSKKITAWAEMARQVAHEIKNPLTPMKLSAQHLQQAWRDRHPKLEQILMESTDTIIDRCEALRRIAIEFSDYARMPGRHIRREDLADLVREARRLYGDTEERQVRFQVAVGDEKLWTRVDRDEVMRLFINLFENSIQAMPKGGQLEVEAERRNGNAEVRIRDTGQGISPENMRRIFEPSFSTKTGGAGLGLPICKAIMEDYGGTIDISSETGTGTTVTLRFPVDETGTAAAEA